MNDRRIDRREAAGGPGRRKRVASRGQRIRRRVFLVAGALLLVLEAAILMKAVLRGPGAGHSIEPPRLILFGDECRADYAPDEPPSVCLARGVRAGKGGTNSRGLWGGEISPEKPPGVRRIVCLGGELVQGEKEWGDEPGLPERLERVLDADRGRRAYEVVNAGIRYSSAEDLVVRYRKDIAPLHPDGVVLLWGTEMFRSCRMFGPREIARLRTFMDSGEESILTGLGGWFERHAGFFTSVRYDRVKLAGKAAALGILTTMSATESGGEGRGLLSDIEGLRNLRAEVERGTRGTNRPEHEHEHGHGHERAPESAGLRGEPSPFADLGGETVVEALAPLLEEARAGGAFLILATVPDWVGCGPEDPTECDAVTASPDDLGAFLAGPVREALETLAARTGATLVDVRRIFSEAEGGRCDLFAPNGVFLGPGGEEVAARVIAPAVLASAAHP